MLSVVKSQPHLDCFGLASNPGFPFRILSRSFGEKSEGKPGRISHVIWWHRDVNLSFANATRHTECGASCVSFAEAEGKMPENKSKAIELYLVRGLFVHQA